MAVTSHVGSVFLPVERTYTRLFSGVVRGSCLSMATSGPRANPEARTGYVRMVLRRLYAFDTALEREVLGSLDPAVRRGLDDSTPLGWSPYEIDVRIAESVRAKHGADGLHEFVLGNSDEAATQNALRPLVNGALRLFGATPHALMRVMPELWRITYRNVSECAPKREGDACIALDWEQTCDAVFDSPAAQGVLFAQAHFPLRVTRTKGTVDPLVLNRPARRITARLRW